MKRLIFSLFLVSLILFGFNSCKRELDSPPYYIPEVDTTGKTVLTIAELIALAPGLPSPGVYAIDSNILVRGIITANDESGNIYKKLYMQDEAGDAIGLSIDAKEMYLKYQVGQTVYFNCDGAYLGNSYGILQLGGIYNGGAGRLVVTDIEKVILKDGLPNKSKTPSAKIVESVNEITAADLNKLITVKNATFVEGGTNIYCKPSETSYPTRSLLDVNGLSFKISVSSYATFARDTLPEGSGDITGPLYVFDGIYQLVIRDLNDVQMYNTVLNENFISDPVSWTKKVVSGTALWNFSATDGVMKINGMTKDGGPANENMFISPAFSLTGTVAPKLTFKSRKKFADLSESKPMTVLISKNYTGDGSSATWSELSTAIFDTNIEQAYISWVGSGEIDLSAYKSSNVRIAFKYKSTSTEEDEATSWEIDNVSIIDK